MGEINASKFVYDVLDGWYSFPMTKSSKKEVFRNISYGRSAVNEILIYLEKHSDVDLYTNITNFRNMMDEFTLRANTQDTNFFFSCYYDVATNVLDTLITYYHSL